MFRTTALHGWWLAQRENLQRCDREPGANRPGESAAQPTGQEEQLGIRDDIDGAHDELHEQLLISVINIFFQ